MSTDNKHRASDSNERIRLEMTELRQELATTLKQFLNDKDLRSKLKPNEIDALKKEFDDLDELLRRIATGLIHIAFFGIASSGKSSIINSLFGEDIAKTGPEYGVTTKEEEFIKAPWCLVDVPGILDNKVNDEKALEEARRAIGHVFVIEREPYGPELELFDLVADTFKDSPRIVFVNKWDMQMNRPTADRDIVKKKIIEKMKKYVGDVDKDIIFGSAALYNPAMGIMERQALPQLEDRMYNDAGTLGEIVNVIDPAKRAESLVGNVKERIMEIREKIARRLNVAFALSAIATSFIPFDTLTVAPALYTGQFFALTKILGTPLKQDDAKKVAFEIIKVCIYVIGAEFIVVSGLETLFSFIPVFGTLLDYAGLSYFKYKRTIIFGEVSIAYIRNNFSFGDDVQATIKAAKEKAMSQMGSYKTNR